MKTLDFYFDFSCPYAYLASTRVEALAERTGAELRPKPFLLGGLFKAMGQPADLGHAQKPARARHSLLDVHRHARRWDVPLEYPKGHPLRTVTALRALLAAGPPFLPLAHRFFRAYWAEGRDVSTDEVVADVLREHGLDAEGVLARARSEEVKADLFARTDEALKAGVFGAPTFVVGTPFGKELFWGQDRMDRVERALGGSPPPELPDPLPSPAELHPIDLWFDYSSPFSALAAWRVHRLLGTAVRFRPFLLGGLFHAIGGPTVPLLEMGPAKRAWSGRDMTAQARDAGFPFKWPSRFPMNTVTALRVTLQAGPDSLAGRALVGKLFHAYWAEDRDISQAAVVEELATSVGLDGAALVAGAADPAVKEALKNATAEAEAAGAFGAPTFVVHTPEGPELFWGNDRLALVLETARKA